MRHGRNAVINNDKWNDNWAYQLSRSRLKQHGEGFPSRSDKKERQSKKIAKRKLYNFSNIPGIFEFFFLLHNMRNEHLLAINPLHKMPYCSILFFCKFSHHMMTTLYFAPRKRRKNTNILHEANGFFVVNLLSPKMSLKDFLVSWKELTKSVIVEGNKLDVLKSHVDNLPNDFCWNV